MRILRIFFPVFAFLLCVSQVRALNEVANNNSISISSSEYTKLLNLGFTDDEIMNMTYQEYMQNRNEFGHVLRETTKYYKNVLQYDSDNQIVSEHKTEIAEEEYYMSHSDNIQPYGLGSGYIETEYKKMTTTIISMSNRFRYKITLEWKNLPKVRSYDIMGIGIDNTVYISSADIFFQQNFCYNSGSCSSANVYSPKKTSTGGAASFPLPTSTSLKSLSSYLYFEVSKKGSGTLNTLNAYGDYAHATSQISNSDSKKYSISNLGIMLEPFVVKYYDSISIAKATWTGSW